MFRKLAFICLFTFSFQRICAQNFHAGVTGGISTTQVAGDQLSGFNKAGIILGAFVNRDLSEKTKLQMEIIFIQKGSRKPIDENDNTFYAMRLSYFEIPVLFKWQVVPKLNFEFGPSVGVLVFSEEETEYGILKGQPPFKNTEISGNVGLSYPLSEKLNLNTRFSSSILPIRPFPGNQTNFFNSGQYNTVLAFSLQYQF